MNEEKFINNQKINFIDKIVEKKDFERTPICGNCKSVFKTYFGLAKHFKKGKCEEIHKCIACDKIFKTKDALLVHIKSLIHKKNIFESKHFFQQNEEERNQYRITIEREKAMYNRGNLINMYKQTEEPILYMSKNKLIKLILDNTKSRNTIYKVVTEFYKLRNFNIKFPQYHSIYMLKYYNRKKVSYFKGNKWVTVDINIINTMIRIVLKFLKPIADDYFRDYKSGVSTQQRNCLTLFNIINNCEDKADRDIRDVIKKD